MLAVIQGSIRVLIEAICSENVPTSELAGSTKAFEASRECYHDNGSQRRHPLRRRMVLEPRNQPCHGKKLWGRWRSWPYALPTRRFICTLDLS
jgi:hypothetical protein